MHAIPQDAYRHWAASQPALPLYFQPLWLDAAAGAEHWDAVMARDRGGHATGVWVYCLRKTFGIARIVMPPYTPYAGPLLFYPHNLERRESRYAFEKKVLGKLLDQLPPVALYYQEWHPGVQNWLPAYWRGYRQTTHYTYLLPDLRNWTAIFEHFRSNVRTWIRKAEASVRVIESDNLAALFQLCEHSLRRQRRAPVLNWHVLQRIDAALAPKAQRLILLAEDDTGRYHAGAYIVWDAHTAYYLLSGADPALRSSGALYLLVWHALQWCGRQGLSFDFEGSMLEPVEEVFRGFDAVLTPHHRVYKAANRWWELLAFAGRKSGFYISSR